MQTAEKVLPVLFIFAENGDVSSTEAHFAAVLPKLHSAAQILHELMMLIINLLSQLGALCSEETRKATVISGTLIVATTQLMCCKASVAAIWPW